jgi:hypothetical protein
MASNLRDDKGRGIVGTALALVAALAASIAGRAAGPDSWTGWRLAYKFG